MTCSAGMMELAYRVMGGGQNRDNLRLLLTGSLKRIGVLQIVVTQRLDQKECPGVRKSPARDASLSRCWHRFPGAWAAVGGRQLSGIILHPDRLLHFRYFPTNEPLMNLGQPRKRVGIESFRGSLSSRTLIGTMAV
jgi:hypothetical protein